MSFCRDFFFYFNRSQPALMLSVTPVLFLPEQVIMSATWITLKAMQNHYKPVKWISVLLTDYIHQDCEDMSGLCLTDFTLTLLLHTYRADLPTSDLSRGLISQNDRRHLCACGVLWSIAFIFIQMNLVQKNVSCDSLFTYCIAGW